jgi:hypothetical protein
MANKDDELDHTKLPEVERRTFLKQAAAAALIAGTGTSASAMAQSALEDDEIKISTPLKSRKVIKSDHKVDGNRQETTLEIEFIDSNNFKLHTSNQMKRIDSGNKYDITIMRAKNLFRSPEDTIPIKSSHSTMIMSGTKGPVVGEYRTDQVVFTVIRGGQVITKEPVEVKVIVNDQFKGMTTSEMVNHALDMRFGKQKGE